MKPEDLRGYFPIELKDGKEYKVEYSFNTIVDMEIHYGSIEEVFNQLNSVSLKNARFLMYMGLKEHHEELTEKEVGRLMNPRKIGEIVRIIEKAIIAAFPTDEDNKKPTKELPR